MYENVKPANYYYTKLSFSEHDVWEVYDSEANAELADHFGRSNMCFSPTCGYFKSSKGIYTIDFNMLTQVNNKTKFKRPIKLMISSKEQVRLFLTIFL